MVASNSICRKTQRLEDLQHARDEARLRRQYQREINLAQQREQIAIAAGIDDVELVDRIIDAGITAESMPALAVAPIAIIAWASGSVSAEEGRAALGAICKMGLTDHPEAVAKFREWLQRRPAKSLMTLWIDVSRCQAAAQRATVRQLRCNQLLAEAEAVALASGGFLGLGRICVPEADVMDHIRSVFA